MAKKIWLGDDTGNVGKYGTAANWSPSGVPIAADDVVIPANSPAITGDLDQSAVPIASFTVEAGHINNIASNIESLKIDPDRFDYGGTGLEVFIDLVTGVSTVDPIIRTAASVQTGEFAFSLTGDNIDELTVLSGTIRIETGTVIATINNLGGNVTTFAAPTAGVVNNAGTTITEGAGAISSLVANGGTIESNAEGDVTNATADSSGVIDFRQSPVIRTVTNIDRSGDGQIFYDPDIITVTNSPTSRGAMVLGPATPI